MCREKCGSLAFFIGDTNSVGPWPPPLHLSFDLNYFSKAPSPNTATLGDRALTYEFGGCGGGEIQAIIRQYVIVTLKSPFFFLGLLIWGFHKPRMDLPGLKLKFVCCTVWKKMTTLQVFLWPLVAAFFS